MDRNRLWVRQRQVIFSVLDADNRIGSHAISATSLSLDRGKKQMPGPSKVSPSNTAQAEAWKYLQQALEALYQLQRVAPDVLDPIPTVPQPRPTTDAQARAYLPDIPAVRAMYNTCRERGDSPEAAIKAIQKAWVHARRAS